MNEKDTIIELQKEVIVGLKKELAIVHLCADKLTKDCKSLSRSRFVMGIGTGMIIAGLYEFVVDAYIASKEKKEENLNDSNE